MANNSCKKIKGRVAYTKVECEVEFTFADLGHYAMIFQPSCQALSRKKMSRVSSAILWYVLGNMSRDGHIYIDVAQVAAVTGYTRQAIYKELAHLIKNKILLRTQDYLKSNVYHLTDMINPRLAYQGKMTPEKAQWILNEIPLLFSGENNVDEFSNGTSDFEKNN